MMDQTSARRVPEMSNVKGKKRNGWMKLENHTMDESLKAEKWKRVRSCFIHPRTVEVNLPDISTAACSTNTSRLEVTLQRWIRLKSGVVELSAPGSLRERS